MQKKPPGERRTLQLTQEMVWLIQHLQQGRTPCDRPHV